MRGARAVSASVSILLVLLAAAQPSLSVTTDSSFYEPGSEVKVTVRGPPRAPVGIEVRGPRGELVALRQLELDARGSATFAFLLDPQGPEGVYTVYAATPGAVDVATFTVVARPSPAILLAPPGQVRAGERAEVLGFVYPGLQLKVKAYARGEGGEWTYLGEFEANASGWFAVPLQLSAAGIYEVRVEFPGAQEYGPASSTASLRVVEVPPQWRVEAPSTAWLGDSFIVNCSGCDTVVARTVIGERRYKCGARIALDAPGPWILYPATGGALGTPAITLVRARLNTRVEGPAEVGVNEPFTLAAHLSIPVPALRVTLVGEDGSILAEPLSRSNGTALARVAIGRARELKVEAAPQRTSVFEPGERQPLTIRVLGERVYVRLTVTDAAGRRLYGSVVEVSGARYEAPMGYVEFAVRAGAYDVRILWRGLTIFSGKLQLEGGNVTVRAELYDFNVTILDFLGRPASGILVELYNGTQRLAVGVTGEDGKLTLIRVPPGIYTIKASDASADIIIPEQTEATLRLPPPPWLAPLAALAILAASAAWAARRYVKVSARKGG